jgi:hypothetical protein
MEERELLTAADIHAFGIEIVSKHLQEDGWIIESSDPAADLRTQPQLTAFKDDETAFFVIRTDVYPKKGRFGEGQEAFEALVRHARNHGASCYFASVGIVNIDAATDTDRSVPFRNARYDAEFDGLIKMDLP